MGNHSALRLFMPQFLLYSVWRPRLQDPIRTLWFESRGEPSKYKRSLRLHHASIHPLNHLDGELLLIAKRCSQMKSECQQSQVICHPSVSRKLTLFSHRTHAFLIETCLCFWMTRGLKQIKAGVSMWTNALPGETPVQKRHTLHVTSTIHIQWPCRAQRQPMRKSSN